VQATRAVAATATAATTTTTTTTGTTNKKRLDDGKRQSHLVAILLHGCWLPFYCMVVGCYFIAWLLLDHFLLVVIGCAALEIMSRQFFVGGNWKLVC
jgi:hypothetical protein